MVLPCAKCGNPAAAAMAFIYEERAVWLDDLVGGVDPTVYPFCADHADRMTPPQGWTLTDRRTAARLFAPLSVA